MSLLTKNVHGSLFSRLKDIAQTNLVKLSKFKRGITSKQITIPIQNYALHTLLPQALHN